MKNDQKLPPSYEKKQKENKHHFVDLCFWVDFQCEGRNSWTNTTMYFYMDCNVDPSISNMHKFTTLKINSSDQLDTPNVTSSV